MSKDCKIISLNDTYDPDVPSNIDIVIYDYQSGDWDGYGHAWYRDRNTKLWGDHCMGHCSCYGAWDHTDWSTYMTESQLIKELSYIDIAGRNIAPEDFDYLRNMKLINAIKKC